MRRINEQTRCASGKCTLLRDRTSFVPRSVINCGCGQVSGDLSYRLVNSKRFFTFRLRPSDFSFPRYREHENVQCRVSDKPGRERRPQLETFPRGETDIEFIKKSLAKTISSSRAASFNVALNSAAPSNTRAKTR